MYKALNDSAYQTTTAYQIGNKLRNMEKMKFCQSCGMPLTDDVLGTIFKGIMLRSTMEVLTDAKSKEMIWREGDEQYYPEGVTDPNYCALKFTATDGRFYSDFYPRSFVIE